MSTFTVLLEDVVADISLSPREAVDAGRVQEFMERYVHLGTGKEALPPILVSYRLGVDGEEQCVLTDGWHRVAAARRLNLKELPAKEFYAEDDAAIFREATRLASTGSKPLTVAERRNAIDRLLLDFPEASDRSIANDAGSTHPTVAKRRRELNLPGGKFTTSEDGEAGTASRKNTPTLTAEQVALKLMHGMKGVLAGGYFLFNRDGNMSKVLSSAALSEYGTDAAEKLAEMERWIAGARQICQSN